MASNEEIFLDSHFQLQNVNFGPYLEHTACKLIPNKRCIKKAKITQG